MIPQRRSADNDPPKMLTASELGKLLNIHTRSVWRLKSRRKIPQPIYVGRLARWPLKKILEWLDDGGPPC